MSDERDARFRHNTIAFWLSDEEKEIVEARIKVAGISKGQYYRSAIIGQNLEVIIGRYRSERLAIALERISEQIERGDTDELEELRVMLQELLLLVKR